MKWWVAFSFLYVRRILLVREASSFCSSQILLPYWPSIPLPFSLLPVLGFWYTLTFKVALVTPHAQLLGCLSLSFPSCTLAFCLQFRQKSQQGLQLTKGKYLYLLVHFIYRPQLKCILSKIIFKLKQHSKYLI